MERPDAWTITDNLHLPNGQENPFAAAIRAVRLPIIITNNGLPDNPIIFANDAFLSLTGYTRQEVNGRNCRFLQGPNTDQKTIQQIRDALADNLDISVDILNYKKDGTAFWNSLYLSPVPNAAGVSQYFFASQLDVTERKQQEFDNLALKTDLQSRTKELEDALQRSTLLIHEVDHRVKNNLQMVSAMLMLQSVSIPDPGIKSTLREMLQRVDAMGLVHKRLYQSANISEFDIADFTKEIAANLVAASGRRDIKLAIEIETVNVKADNAASIALIVNETITNALKHGLPAGKPGDLLVSVKPRGAVCEIVVQDNGAGMPSEAPKRTSFGKTLVETLVKQLRAKIEWLPALSGGTQVLITFPLT